MYRTHCFSEFCPKVFWAFVVLQALIEYRNGQKCKEPRQKPRKFSTSGKLNQNFLVPSRSYSEKRSRSVFTEDYIPIADIRVPFVNPEIGIQVLKNVFQQDFPKHFHRKFLRRPRFIKKSAMDRVDSLRKPDSSEHECVWPLFLVENERFTGDWDSRNTNHVSMRSNHNQQKKNRVTLLLGIWS